MRIGFVGGIVAVLVLVLIIVAYGSLFTVYQTKQAIVVRLGNPVRVVSDPGLHLKYPITDIIIGIIPVTMAVVGNLLTPTYRWRTLAVPIALVVVGMVIVNAGELTGSGSMPDATLLARALGIAAVAVLCGFRSQSHLGRVFRNATGLTPGEYRRQTQL